MTLSKQDLAKQLEVRESSSELLEQLAALYHSEAGANPTRPSSRRESLRRRSLQPGLITPRTLVAPTPAQPVLETILRRVGVAPESVRGERGCWNLHDKRRDMLNILHSFNKNAEAPLLSQLVPLDQAAQLLGSSLHIDSQYETSLRDPLEPALSGLEGELVSLQNGVQRLNLDVLHQRDSAREGFMQRWG